MDEDVHGARVLDVEKSDADDRVRFVERAKGGHADMEFWQARSVAKRRAPVDTGAGFRLYRFSWGGLPARSSGLLDPAAGACQSD
jgi:hypothetical protein